MTDRAAYPACSPPPFLEPVFLRARLSQGMVRSTPSDTPETNRNNPSGGCVMGDLLKIQNEGEHDIDEVHSKTFLIQRKLRDTPFGSIRVCFAVKEVDGSYRVIDAENEKDDEHGVLAVSVASIARIKSDPRHSQSFYTELSALQLVESLRKEQFPLHVQGTRIIATDDLFIYTVVPNHTEGTLFDYCNARGVLSENEARYFFLQILAGLVTLKRVAICHRNISWENILLRGNQATIAGLSSALRIPLSESDLKPFMILSSQMPASVCTSSQFLAPELFEEEPFDGYAVDLWSAAIVLFAMIVGIDALFILPSPQDHRFMQITMNRRLDVYLRNHGYSISAEATDLLQQMLTAEKSSRPTLEEVWQHTWVKWSSDPPRPSLHLDH